MNRMLIALLTSTLVMAGCGREPPSKGLQLSDAQLAELSAKRRDNERKLKAMNDSELIEALAADAGKGDEPFNSPAYREAISRGAELAPELEQALSKGNPDASALFALLALRAINPEGYRALDAQIRIPILIEALRTSRMFNTWGIPHLFWEDAAQAIIEEGAAMDEPLRKLLEDRREAPVWGSEGATEQARYRYRVRDYAWALLNEIHGQRAPLPEDPKARDELIEAMPQLQPTS